MSGLRTVSVVDAVAHEIRERIFNGTYRPGDSLAETQLAEQYEVPRPTVRSAIVTLMHEGVLRREPNRSMYVPKLSTAELSDLFAVRKLIELEAVQRVTPLTTNERDLEYAVRMMEVLSEDDSWDEVLKYDFEFHSAVVHATGSERLQKFFRTISSEMRLALTSFRSVRSSARVIAAEHRALLELLKAGDVDAAIAGIRHHIEEAEVFIEAELREHGRVEENPKIVGQ